MVQLFTAEPQRRYGSHGSCGVDRPSAGTPGVPTSTSDLGRSENKIEQPQRCHPIHPKGGVEDTEAQDDDPPQTISPSNGVFGKRRLYRVDCITAETRRRHQCSDSNLASSMYMEIGTRRCDPRLGCKNSIQRASGSTTQAQWAPDGLLALPCCNDAPVSDPSVSAGSTSPDITCNPNKVIGNTEESANWQQHSTAGSQEYNHKRDRLRLGIEECKRSIKSIDYQITSLQREKEEAIASLHQAMTVLKASDCYTVCLEGSGAEELLPVKPYRYPVKQEDYVVGMNLGKRKAYDELGNQISKSCHQCQEQHVPFVCKSGLSYGSHSCRASYCLRCLKSWYPGLSLQESAKCCPRCRKICKCKACLRKSKSLKLLALTPDERKALFNSERDAATSRSLVGDNERSRTANMGKDGEAHDIASTTTPSGRVSLEVGTHVGREKIFDEKGSQLSKSCHQCQEQHIPFVCRSGRMYSSHACRASYCSRCIGTWYPGYTVSQLEDSCPRCRGFCNCKACLRKENNSKLPNLCEEQNVELAEHLLRSVSGHVKKILEEQDREASASGCGLEDVSVEKPDGTGVICKRCLKGIPDLHRTCKRCSYYLCSTCCSELRAGEDSCHEHCINCKQPMPLARLIGNKSLGLLREAVERYATSEVVKSNCFQSAWNIKDDLENCPVPLQKLRLVSRGKGSAENFLVVFDASDFDPSFPERPQMVRMFQRCMSRGEPVIIRNSKGIMDWSPETIFRATHEVGNKAQGIQKSNNIAVIDCKDWTTGSVSQRTFFNMYQRGAYLTDSGEEVMLKVKDWPPNGSFCDRLKRHHQDFREMLPVQEYMHPVAGPLNMAGYFPTYSRQPDRSPVTFIALGRRKENEGNGDSVTKLHADQIDRVNIMCGVQYQTGEESAIRVRWGNEMWDEESYGNAGAVWDFVRRRDIPKVRDYIVNARDGPGQCDSKFCEADPVQDGTVMLTKRDREVLKRDYEVDLLHIEQHLHEAVCIPAGVPHQVRNLRSCIKVALDFLSPESMGAVLDDIIEMQGYNKADREKNPNKHWREDKWQPVTMMLHAVQHAVQVVKGCKKGGEQ